MTFGFQHVPSTVGFHTLSTGVHENHVKEADGSITMNSVTMQNHVIHRMGPSVSRSSVTPNEILENVDAKHDIDAPMDKFRTMIGRF